jgi:hypothetical protein
MKERRSNMRAALKARGVCTTCGSAKAREGKLTCDYCYETRHDAYLKRKGKGAAGKKKAPPSPALEGNGQAAAGDDFDPMEDLLDALIERRVIAGVLTQVVQSLDAGDLERARRGLVHVRDELAKPFERTPDVSEWTCPKCETVVPATRLDCTSCGLDAFDAMIDLSEIDLSRR